MILLSLKNGAGLLLHHSKGSILLTWGHTIAYMWELSSYCYEWKSGTKVISHIVFTFCEKGSAEEQLERKALGLGQISN